VVSLQREGVKAPIAYPPSLLRARWQLHDNLVRRQSHTTTNAGDRVVQPLTFSAWRQPSCTLHPQTAWRLHLAPTSFIPVLELSCYSFCAAYNSLKLR